MHQDRVHRLGYFRGVFFMVRLRVVVTAPVGLNAVLELCIGQPGAPGPQPRLYYFLRAFF